MLCVWVFCSAAHAACPPAMAPHLVQGATDSSPLQGQRVQVRGVVTYSDQIDTPQRNSLRGFFIQGPPSYQPQSSDGLFIYAPNHPVNIGDDVVVDGDVLEFHGLTEVTRVRRVQRCGHSAPPAPITIEAPAERYEGMRVQLPATRITDNYRLFGFGELVVAQGDQSWILEDGSNDRRLTYVPFGMAQDPSLLANGRPLAPLTGVLSWRWDQWVVLPDTALTPTDTGRWRIPRQPVDRTRLVVWNLKNLFNGDQQGFRASRGASNAEEWMVQRTAIARHLAELNADIVALQEVEHDYGTEHAVLPELVAAIAQAGGRTYDIIALPRRSGDDQITQAFLYDPEQVRPNGQPLLIDKLPRPSLAQRFVDRQAQVIGIVNVHLKSRAGCANQCAEPRTQGVNGLAAWLAQQPSAPWLLAGDFNTLPDEALWQPLLQQGAQPVRLSAPTFWYRGQAQQLDHVWVSGMPVALQAQVIQGHAELPPMPFNHPLFPATQPWGVSDHNPIVMDW